MSSTKEEHIKKIVLIIALIVLNVGLVVGAVYGPTLLIRTACWTIMAIDQGIKLYCSVRDGRKDSITEGVNATS